MCYESTISKLHLNVAFKNLKNLSDTAYMPASFYLMVDFSLLNEIMDSPNNLGTID